MAKRSLWELCEEMRAVARGDIPAPAYLKEKPEPQTDISPALAALRRALVKKARKDFPE